MIPIFMGEAICLWALRLQSGCLYSVTGKVEMGAGILENLRVAPLKRTLIS